MNEIVSIQHRQAVTTSLIVAEVFKKQHKSVLRAIDQMDCSKDFNRRNFAPVGLSVHRHSRG